MSISKAVPVSGKISIATVEGIALDYDDLAVSKNSAADTQGNPSALRSSYAGVEPAPIDTEQAKEFLTSQGWPPGLQKAFLKLLPRIAYRYFICDDSGSMMQNDGNRIVTSGATTK